MRPFISSAILVSPIRRNPGKCVLSLQRRQISRDTNTNTVGSLAGKVTIVTGANSGIGEAISALFASRGALVTLCGRNEERLQAAKERCIAASGGQPDRYLTVSGDLTDSQLRSKILQKTLEKFGNLDILILNAATVSREDKITVGEEVFDRLMSTNLKSAFFLAQAAIPQLAESKGSIVAISSLITSNPSPGRHVVYSMAKAGLDQMTKAMALNLGPKGIRVNAINPGFITDTRALRDFSDGTETHLKELDEKVMSLQDAKHPLHGRCATPEEVAEVVAFLASDAARYVTGQCLPVDAGYGLTSMIV